VAVHTNLIQVYSTWSFTHLATLKGHTGRIRAISWSKNDCLLISCGMDGSVYTWDMQKFSRCQDFIQKGIDFFSVSCSPDARHVYTLGSDKSIKVNN
jgi:WD40 repeat protein